MNDDSIWSGSISGTIVRLGEIAGADTSKGNMATCLQAAADRIRGLEQRNESTTRRGHMTDYRPLPDIWLIDTDHFNAEGERLSLASSDHLDHAGKTLLIVWDDPSPDGTGIAALALLDDATMTWLVEAMLHKSDGA